MSRPLVPLLLVPLLLAAAAVAFCRYTVRDVAFVDFGDEGYTLHAVVATEDTPGLADEVRRAASVLVLDSNVGVDVVEVGSVPTPEAEEFLARNAVASLPALVLAAPDGRSLVRDLPARPDETDARTHVLEAVVSSPARRALVDGVIDRYGVVLLVEGSDAAANRAAEAVAARAIDEVKSVFDRMPKDVGEPPVRVRVPFAERRFEEVLLWSIGLDEEDAASPAVAVFMGRGRRVGPVLVGEEITDAGLFGILSVIGQSCECDLDRSWMQGPRPPLRWGAATRERVTRRLGFEPESPLVRSEILGILARGPGAFSRPKAEGRGLEELLLGYEELVVEDAPRAAPPPPPASRASPAEGKVTPSAAAEPPPIEATAAFAILPLVAAVVCGLLVLGVLVTGTVLLLARRER